MEEAKEAVKELPTFLNGLGYKLFCKYWTPADASNQTPRGLAFIVHGFAEHCEWYDNVAKPLAERGVLVAAHDHIGHGKSEGMRAQVNNFENYVDDLLQHVSIIRKSYPNVPLFVIGHSMGGTVTIKAVLREPYLFKGMIVIGPAIIPNPDAVARWKIAVGKVFAAVLPSLPVDRLDSTAISRDPQVVKRYAEDPLVYHGGMRLRWGMCMVDTLEEVQKRLEEVQLPMLIIQGEHDRLCERSGAELLYEKALSEDKKLSVYPGAFHQVHNEPDGVGNQAIEEITSWIADRV